MVERFIAGGWMMWVLLSVSILAFALIAERVYVLYFRLSINSSNLLTQIRNFIEQGGNFSRAIEVCNSHGKHPVASVLKAGLIKGNKSDKEIQRAMEESASKVVPAILRGILFISMIANVATLLGLLGTIDGLIDAFEAVGAASESEKQKALSDGISKAMLTTMGGLSVAIPCIVAYTFVNNKANNMVDKIEETSLSLFNFLSDRNRAQVKRNRG
jgi:biopolymer transport protein ExbB